MSDVAIETVTLAVITMIIIGSLTLFGTQRVLDLEERITMRTVEIPAARVGSSVYMMDGMEEAELVMKFENNYSIVRHQGDPYLKYEMEKVLTSLGETSSSEKIEVPNSISFSFEEGKSKDFCIRKTPRDLVLTPESC